MAHDTRLAVSHPGGCPWCGQPVGSDHASTCVVVVKRVKVRYILEIEIDVPHGWDRNMIEFHRNDGSWCASNAIGDIERYRKSIGADCLCREFRCEFVEVVDDTPRLYEGEVTP